ncbi:MAG: extracellular solute-binding protein, partial [Candidatus Rifleibacteriota bacterium]
AGISAEMTLKIWDFPRWLEPGEKVDRFVWMNRKLAEFEQQNPGVKVELTKLTWSRGQEKLKIAALGGNYPDIAPGTIPLLFIKENMIAPIDEYLSEEDRADYFPAALDAFRVKDKVYGWPWYMGGQLLFVNNDLFASAGAKLPVDGRWTIDEFTTTMQQIKNFMGQKSGESGALPSLTDQGYYPLGLYFQKNETANFPFLMGFGGDFIDREGKFAGNRGELHQGFKWLLELQKSGIIPGDSGGRTSNDIWTAFGREHRLAAGAFGLWGIQALTDKFPMNFSVVHFPSQPGQINPAFLAISGLYVFRNDDPERVKMAMKLARFLTIGENQKSLIHYAQFPTRNSAGNIYEGRLHMSNALAILREGRAVFNDSRWPQIDEEIEYRIQETLMGKEPVETAMQKAGVMVDRILEAESGSIKDDISKGSLFGRIVLILAILSLFFALFSGQAHLIMIVPAISIIGIFLFYPLADAFIIAFRNYRIGEVGGFTLHNFTQALSDPKFVKACYNTVLYSVVVVPANTLTALIVASLIYSLHGRAKAFFKGAYYLPGVASVVVLTMVWRWIFNTEVGLANTMLRWLHLSPIGWLSDPEIAFWSVIATGVFKSPGGSMLIYLASMANIPESLYESAELEGATSFEKWWHITVPLLRGTTSFLLITGAIASLQVFAQVMMLTDGGPGISTEVVVHRVYTSAFRDFDFGLSAAMALLLFVTILIITVIQRKLTNQEVEYLG